MAVPDLVLFFFRLCRVHWSSQVRINNAYYEKCACVCVWVCVFIKLHITAQSGPIILVIILCVCLGVYLHSCVYGVGKGVFAFAFPALTNATVVPGLHAQPRTAGKCGRFGAEQRSCRSTLVVKVNL